MCMNKFVCDRTKEQNLSLLRFCGMDKVLIRRNWSFRREWRIDLIFLIVNSLKKTMTKSWWFLDPYKAVPERTHTHTRACTHMFLNTHTPIITIYTLPLQIHWSAFPKGPSFFIKCYAQLSSVNHFGVKWIAVEWFPIRE